VEEKRIRTIVKTISWRAVATGTTMLVVYIYTREMVLSLGVGAAEVIAKLALYYVHERLWGRLGWGRSAAADSTSHAHGTDDHAGEDADGSIAVGYVGG
jgi:uncharacterized membrane protein